jgi:hypothetical protein
VLQGTAELIFKDGTTQATDWNNGVRVQGFVFDKLLEDGQQFNKGLVFASALLAVSSLICPRQTKAVSA